MRLLNTSTIELHEFIGDNIPKYAILSHRWGEEEVSFQELSLPKSRDKAGYSKILNSCALARKYGFEYLWIDTCCIDKSSSAEISEAINSMYRWYAEAEVCYVHLADILLPNDGLAAPRKFVDSEWFKRGWTLQELLAPENMIFYDQQWQEIGTKRTLKSHISTATRIHPDYLDSWYISNDFKGASIAERMSWASLRKTSRPEDIAYCLLGIMGVNIPLLYGEGTRAFSRLQKELIRNGSDESIYAWTIPSRPYCAFTGMLAPSPKYFESSGTIRSIDLDNMRHAPLSITNRGLAMTVASRKCAVLSWSCCYEVPLACANIHHPSKPLRLYLRQNEDGTTDRLQGRILQSIAKVNGVDFETNSFYVKLDCCDPDTQDVSTRLLPNISEPLYGSSQYIEFRLNPAIQQCLRKNILSDEWEPDPTAEMAFMSRGISERLRYLDLEFYYKGTHMIQMMWETNSLAIRIFEKSYKIDAHAYPKEDGTSTEDMGQHTNGSDLLAADDSIMICDPESISGIDDCYTRKLGDEDFLWVSRKDVENPNPYRHVLIEVDISSVDRGKIF